VCRDTTLIILSAVHLLVEAEIIPIELLLRENQIHPPLALIT